MYRVYTLPDFLWIFDSFEAVKQICENLPMKTCANVQIKRSVSGVTHLLHKISYAMYGLENISPYSQIK